MPKNAIAFHWKYVILPAAILFLSIVMAAYFYHLLPADMAYHFKNGSPDRWVSRSTFIAFMLVPQFLLALLAILIIRGMMQLSTRFQQLDNTAVTGVLTIMGNMLAMPQIILSFAMANIFSYNAYQTRIMPLWVFAVMVMVLGGIILGAFFLSVIRQVRRLSG